MWNDKGKLQQEKIKTHFVSCCACKGIGHYTCFRQNTSSRNKNSDDNEHSHAYHCHNAGLDVKDSGPVFMVGRAIMGTMNAHRYMNPNDILLHLLLAKFTATLTIEKKK